MRYNVQILITYIVVLLLISTLPISAGLSRYDKLAHFFMFFILTILLLTISIQKYKKIFVFLIALIIAAITEIIQIPIPYRSFSWLDLVADAIGITVAMLIGWRF